MSTRSRKEQIEEMLASDPEDAFLRYGLAMEFASAGDDVGAIEQLRELLRRDSEYVPGYLQLGRALIRQGEDDLARATLRDGIVVATRKKDDHAAGEMKGFLDSLE